MSSVSPALLELIAEVVNQRRDLPQALEQSNLHGAKEIAAALRRGEDLPTALSTVLSPRLAQSFAGPCPDPAAAALLVAELLAAEEQRRRLLRDQLAYPLLSFAVLALGMVAVELLGIVQLPWLLVGALLILGAAGGLLLPLWWQRRPPGQRQQGNLQAAESWQRAALVLRWRLSEAEARRWCGEEALRLATSCAGAPGGEAHCHTMAAVHRQAALRGVRRDGLLMGLWIQACGATIAILMAISAWQEIFAVQP